MKAKLFYLAVIIAGAGASFGLAKNLYSTYQNTQLVAKAAQKLAALKLENTRLKEENNAAREPTFIEREARDKLGLVKPGEVVVVLPDKTASLSASVVAQPKGPRSIWQQWVGLFFGG